jgi:hypothetical protein
MSVQLSGFSYRHHVEHTYSSWITEILTLYMQIPSLQSFVNTILLSVSMNLAIFRVHTKRNFFFICPLYGLFN